MGNNKVPRAVPDIPVDFDTTPFYEALDKNHLCTFANGSIVVVSNHKLDWLVSMLESLKKKAEAYGMLAEMQDTNGSIQTAWYSIDADASFMLDILNNKEV